MKERAAFAWASSVHAVQGKLIALFAQFGCKPVENWPVCILCIE